MSISPHIKELIKNQNERLDVVEKMLNDLVTNETKGETPQTAKRNEYPEEELLRKIRELKALVDEYLAQKNK